MNLPLYELQNKNTLMLNDKKKVGRPKKEVIVTTPTFNEVARHGWNSEDEVGKFIGSLIKMSRVMTVLEVGVFEGETTKSIIEALPHGGQYIGVDINDYRVEDTKAMMENTNGKVIEFVLGTSINKCAKMMPNHFDLIFVDGDHSWDNILPEFKVLERLLSRGGVFVYHDTIHLEDPRHLVEYAKAFGYNTVTLNTPEGRGLSILHRNFA
jgi:predicted O-methyltransferase YrrM